MRAAVLAAFLMFNALESQAQIQNSWWFVGNGVGNGRLLHWNNGLLNVADSTELGVKESSAAVSDSASNLLFYTNGCNIYNRNHQPMPHGKNLPCDLANFFMVASVDSLGSGSESPNGALVINDPGNPERYYVFGRTRPPDVPGTFVYHMVDMTLDGSLGDLVAPYTRTLDSSAFDGIDGRIAAVRHANGRDWWVLNSRVKLYEASPFNWQIAYFYIKKFLITPSGIQDSSYQVICNGPDGSGFEGEIAVSKAGDKIALCRWSKSLIAMDFDRCSGLISNCTVIDTVHGVWDTETGNYFYGVEFSPNGKVLYAASGKQLFQYDLTAPVPSATKYLVWSHNQFTQDAQTRKGIGQLELGLDDKIYVSATKFAYWYLTPADSNWLWLKRINYPDSLGVACGFQLKALYTGVTMMGLPNEVNWSLGALIGSGCDTVAEYLQPTAQFAPDKPVVCVGTCVQAVNASAGGVSFHWSFPGGSPITSTEASPTVCYPAPGAYAATLVVSNYAGTDTLQLSDFVTVDAQPVATVSVSGQTLSASAAQSYQWLNCDTHQPVASATQQTFTPTVSGSYAVIVHQGTCADTSACTDVAVGIAAPPARAFAVYPNPASDNVFINLAKTAGPVRIELCDVAGRSLQTLFNGFANDIVQVATDGFANGVYILQIQTEGLSVTQPLAIVRQ